MAGKTYRVPQAVRVFQKSIQFSTSGFATSIFIGEMPQRSTPVAIRVIRFVEFTVGAYFSLGFAAGGIEWTGYVYLADSGSKPAETTKMVVTGTSPKIYDCFEWSSLTIPLAADRNVFFRGGTVGGTITQGDLLVQVLYQE